MTTHLLYYLCLLFNLMIVSLWSSIPSALAGYSIAASDPAIDQCGATATLLHDGTVLVAGGAVYQTGIRFGVTIDKAEIFDPATNTWSDAASMGVTRKGHSAVALPSGKVLVVAGSTTTGAYSPPMLYDPGSNTWSSTGAPAFQYREVTLTLLKTGKVLAVGDAAEASLYDPASGIWSAGGTPPHTGFGQTATLLPSGKVLVAGGSTPTAQLYDPDSNTWSSAGSMSVARNAHTATLLPSGKVLIQGGAAVTAAELYDPSTNTWSSAGSNPSSANYATATLLPNGKVAVMGGAIAGTGSALSKVMLFDPATNTWSEDAGMQMPRLAHTATLLSDGKVFLTGTCEGPADPNGWDQGEMYIPSNPSTWAGRAPLATPRRDHVATILGDGKTLVIGGSSNGTYLRSSEIYDPSSQSWTSTGSLNTPRSGLTATLMVDGRVLVVGGFDGANSLSSAEVYDQATGIWSQAGSMSGKRKGHTATLLPNGDVLIIGGFDCSTALRSAEVYSASSQSWKSYPDLNVSRGNHTATLLDDGRVIVTGGFDGSSYLDSVEVYDPVGNRWTTIAPLATGRAGHTATLSSDGSVMVAGGYDGSAAVATIELLDTDDGTWAEVDSALSTVRTAHSATVLQDGSVLFAGGSDGAVYPAATDVYSPVNDLAFSGGSLSTPRVGHTATLQADGSVLVVGGYNSVSGVLASAEAFIPQGAVGGDSKPSVTAVEKPTGTLGLVVTGNDLAGKSEGSSGTSNSSSTAIPMLQLTRLDNGSSMFLFPESTDPWTANRFVSEPLADLFMPAGYYQATVFANATPGISRYLAIDSSMSPSPALRVLPVPLDFGDAAVATTKTITVSNSGSTDLVVSDMTLGGTDASLFALPNGNPCRSSIAPAESCQVDVVFSPASSSPANAVLRILSNDPNNESYDMPLVSAGSAPKFNLGVSFSGSGTGTVSATPSPPGILCSSNCSEKFATGTSVTLTALGTGDSFFVKWLNCDTVKGSMCTVAMSGDRSVTVAFSNLGIATETLPDAYKGNAFSTTLAATGGTAPYSWSISGGTLPAGLTLNSSGVISGTPSTAGTSSFLVQVTDASSAKLSTQLGLTVNAALTISTTSLASAVTGTAYSQTLTTSGGKSPYTWNITAGALPAGLTLNASTGSITGTPISSGTSSFTVQVTDASSVKSTKALSLTTSAGTLAVSTAALATGYVGAAYNQPLAASGGNAPFTWSITRGTLPAGLSLNASTGSITGAPTATVSGSSITFQVKDASAKTATKALSITVNAGVSISAAILSAGNVGGSYIQTLAATGGKTPYSWSISAGSLPAGMSLDGASGVLTGTPTTSGSSSFTVLVKDGNNSSATKALSITINPAVLSVSTVTVQPGYVGVPYSQPLAASAGTAPYVWSITSGTLPAGLTLASAGTITGTPTTAVSGSSITFQVKDSVNATASKALTITINAAPSITTSTLAAATAGTPYSQTLAATGGKAPYTWSLASGTLPAGMSLNATSGVIAGTPTTTGTSSFSVQLTDQNSSKATKSLSLTVSAPALTITTTSLAKANANIDYDQMLTAIGGTPPYTWSISSGALPANFFLNSSTGELYGYPSAPGSGSFAVKVKDAVNATATKALSITINETPAVSPNAARAVVGTPYYLTLTVTGSYPPYTMSIVSPDALPPGLTFNPSINAISGTPTVVADYRFIIRTKDVNNVTCDIPYSMWIDPEFRVKTDTVTHAYVGANYQQVLSAGGGFAPYTWSIVGGKLPAGLQLESIGSDPGVIDGTPTTAGTTTLILQVADAAGKTATKALSIDVFVAPVIDSIQLADGSVGAAYAQTLTATGGKGPLTWKISSGSLPAGLQLDASTGVISGMPTTVGNSIFTVRVSDANNRISSKEFNLNVSPAIARIKVTPTDVNFGYLTAGKVSTNVLTVTNVSQDELVIGAVSRPAAPFSISSDACSGRSLAPGAACAISLQFTAQHQGDFSGALSIPSNDSYYPNVEVPLTGHGVFPYVVPDTGAGDSHRSPIVLAPSSSQLTVNDGNTLLQWQRQSTGAKMTWAEADNYCRNLNLDGQGGWRLPNAAELSTIVDYGHINPSIDPAIFTGIVPDNYWTSTIGVGVVNGDPVPNATAVSFAFGEAAPILQSDTAYTLCTRGEELTSRLILNNGEQPTSSDLSTGLVWMAGGGLSTTGEFCYRGDNCHPLGWDDAQAYCGSIIYAGQGDWRAPTVKELATLPGGTSWSVTPSGKTDAKGNTEAMLFSYGVISSTPKSSFSDYVLRCVRGGNNTTVRNVADVGNVAVMEVTGDMNADASDCMVYTPIRQAIASEFIRTHGDNYDFLVFLTTFDFAMPPGHDGFYLEAKNDTFGIGTPIIDRTGDFGSPGKLQGTIDLGNLMPLAANPYGPKLDPTVTMLNHEIMHRWGVHALFKDANGTLNEGLIGETNSHWSYLLDTKGSVMYGNAWMDNRDGTFTSTAVKSVYSPLDLYLMGMIPKEQVPPMLLIDNQSVDKTKLPELGATITGTAKTVTIQQIVDALGERIPDAAHSQKQFNVGFVLVTRPGMPTGNAPAAIEALRSTWAGRFAALTQGKASVANVPAALTLTIDTPADGATITGPDVTVSGTIINTTGAETGVIVNGVAATVTGSRFMLNHLPVQSGANSLTVNATDSNGLVVSATRNITATPGDYFRVTTNVESGIAPLTVSLRVKGSFGIDNPIITPSGPVPVSLTPGADPATYTMTLSAEGTYTFSASALAPDGTNYSDTITITVLSKSELETLLQAKWDGIKAKIAASDVEGAVSFLPSFSQDYYRNVFTSLGNRLPTYSEDLPPIKLKSAFDSTARCLLLRQENVLGVQKTVGYQIYFIKEKGIWKFRYF